MLTEEGIGRNKKRHQSWCLFFSSPDPLIRPLCGHLLPMGEGFPQTEKLVPQPQLDVALGFSILKL